MCTNSCPTCKCSKNIKIVGSGLVGSLLASYLGKKGYHVDVYEGRPDMRKTQISAGKSINMACSTRGWKALDKIGVGDLVRKAAIPMVGRMIHHQDKTTSFQPYGKEGQAIYSISRAGLNKILMNFAEENHYAHFHFNEKCESINIDQKTIRFKNQLNDTESDIPYDVLFGADGAFSAVRRSLSKEDRFTYSQTYIEHSYKELSIPANNDDFAMEPNALHIWPRGNFMLIALPNPDKTFTCTLFLPFEGANSFAELTDKESLYNFFEKQFPDALELMPNLENDFHHNPTSSLCLINCTPWSQKGHTALIGDACHAIVPFYGQGMIAGFEDCDILDDCIDDYKGNWEQIFKAYEILRKPNTDAIAKLALQNFVEMRDLVGNQEFLYRKEIEAKLHELYPDKYIPLYSMVSFSNLPYAQAYDTGIKQESFIKKIMAIENIEEKLNSSEIEHLVNEFVNNI